MERNIYEKEGYVKTLVKNDVIHVTWEKLFDAQTIYDSCNAQMEEVQKGNLKAVIIDISHAKGTPPQECQQWFGEVLFPGFKKSANFKGLINVLPENAITKMGASNWKRTATADQFGFQVFEAGSVDAAYDIVKDL